MQRTVLMAAAVAAFLSVGAPINRAAAMPVARRQRSAPPQQT